MEDQIRRAPRTNDRRWAPRFHRLVQLLLIQADDPDVYLVTTDISICGAFLHSPTGLSLPVGKRVRLLHYGDDSAPILFRGVVARTVVHASRVSRVPGIAVQFVELRTLGGPSGLAAFFETVGGKAPSQETLEAIVDTGFEASFFPPSPVDSVARQVHKERVSPGRTLPSDLAETERLMRAHATVSERRRTERYPVREELSFYVDGLPHAGAVLSASRKGLFIQTDQTLPPVGTRVTLNYPVSEEPTPLHVKVSGRVARHWDPAAEALPGVGVRIDRIDELRRTGIFRLYLRKLSTGHAG